MSLKPETFPDGQPIITKVSPSAFDHVVGPKLGVGNELRIPLNPAPTRSLVIGGGRKTQKKIGMYHKKGGKYYKMGGKYRRVSRKRSKMMKKYKSKCRKSLRASCARRFRKNNKPYLKGGKGGNIIDSAVYGIDPSIDTLSGALATPRPVLRSNACVV
jgi:hypothetical protein